MTTEAKELDSELDRLKARQRALLTKRERQQLERAVVLLGRVYERRCKALGIEPGYGDEDDDHVAWPAHVADAYVSALLEGDEDERRAVSNEAERLRMGVWMESGTAFDGLAAALRGR